MAQTETALVRRAPYRKRLSRVFGKAWEWTLVLAVPLIFLLVLRLDGLLADVWKREPIWPVGEMPGVQVFPGHPKTHLPEGVRSVYQYDSDPPTSGPHWEDVRAPMRVVSVPLPIELQIHELEHGSILMQYNCEVSCPDLVDQLASIAQPYDYVIVAPNPALPARVVVSAWRRLLKLDDFDEQRVREFITGALALVMANVSQLQAPVVDFWSDRQADSAMIARNFIRHGFNIFWPQVDWSPDPHGFSRMLEAEFQLHPYAAALLSFFGGDPVAWGRLLALLTGVLVLYCLFELARTLRGPVAAAGAAWLVAGSPLFLQFSGSFMPHVPSIAAGAASLLLLQQWSTTGRSKLFWAAAATGALAVLLRPTAFHLVVPALAFFRVGARSGGPGKETASQGWRSYQLFIAAVGWPSVLWYSYAHIMFMTGQANSLGLFPPQGTTDKLVTLEDLLREHSYRAIVQRLWGELLFPGWGVSLIVLGCIALLAVPRGTAERPTFRHLLYLWFAAVGVDFLVTMKAHVAIPYYQIPNYQIPVVLPLVLLAGHAAAVLYERVGDMLSRLFLQRHRWRSAVPLLRVIMLINLLLAALGVAWSVRGVLDALDRYRAPEIDLQAALLLARVAEPSALAYVPRKAYRYYGDHKGYFYWPPRPQVLAQAASQAWWSCIHYIVVPHSMLSEPRTGTILSPFELVASTPETAMIRRLERGDGRGP